LETPFDNFDEEKSKPVNISSGYFHILGSIQQCRDIAALTT
jgi:hypothetical protein